MMRIGFLGLMMGFVIAAYGQSGDDILGTWLNEKKDSKIEVYKKDGAYYGRIIWLKNNVNDDGTSPKVDRNNPDEKLQKRTIVGTIILQDLEWDKEDKEWNEGEIYDPRSGNTYSCFAKLESQNSLYLKGYIGFSLIGRSTTWTRVE
ncbi:MAG: DUF2147 domain-containing protein [Bacteroidota bacterium]|nr:DUF2147 domain-containing protein [Bacteroidota bacterium]MDX5447372.1 DUF2147 domain-containing protein [Bacteroidota bacterium]MDX5506047.1 DUF2147 domain-containing protein [Bacteroidota bacterium]